MSAKRRSFRTEFGFDEDNRNRWVLKVEWTCSYLFKNEMQPVSPVFRKFGVLTMSKYGKRFLVGWIVSSMIMFGTSYLWHGIVLNDYQFITYPLGVYLIAASIAYFFIGFLVSRAFILEFFDRFSRHPLIRGPLIGFACGILVYIIATAVHVTFNKDMDLKYLLLDITWQGIEQAFGGLVIGIVYMTVYERFPNPAVEKEVEDGNSNIQQ
jgi:MFS family permease